MLEQISLFPYKKVVIEDIDVEKIRNVISLEVNNNFKLNKIVEGFFVENKFSVRRIIRYGYSAFPLIVVGNLFLKDGKDCVKIIYKFHYVVNIILMALFCLLLSMFLTDLFPDKYSEEVNLILNINSGDVLVNSFLWVLCFYVVTLILYNFELKRINKFLLKALPDGTSL